MSDIIQSAVKENATKSALVRWKKSIEDTVSNSSYNTIALHKHQPRLLQNISLQVILISLFKFVIIIS